MQGKYKCRIRQRIKNGHDLSRNPKDWTLYVKDIHPEAKQKLFSINQHFQNGMYSYLKESANSSLVQVLYEAGCIIS